ncbi:MAG TPA: hypothetical protein EYN91_10045 [Candidatus Melainabacteria bacterium]|nr:hypothetical protein [Candidatus Melainabacteria bacterium]
MIFRCFIDSDTADGKFRSRAFRAAVINRTDNDLCDGSVTTFGDRNAYGAGELIGNTVAIVRLFA